jgi:D-tyrosyl-tRNA(Tyr) deacylase
MRQKMRAVIQIVKHCKVHVNSDTVSAIGRGLLVLLGVTGTDTTNDADYLAEKISNLRIFPDRQGRMNLGLRDIAGEMLVVSQFTLMGDCRKGRRPSFSHAAAPDQAEHLYEHFVKQVRHNGLEVQTGRFGAKMAVDLVNDGPVTFIVESK